MEGGAWLVGARVRHSVILVIVVVRRTLRLTRVDRRPFRSSLNMLAHARIATRMMTRPAPTRALPPTILLFFAHYLIQGKILITLDHIFLSVLIFEGYLVNSVIKLSWAREVLVSGDNNLECVGFW